MKIFNFKKMDQKRLGEGGFTLLEVLIALTILAIGLLMVAGFQITAIKANGIGYKMSEGVVVSQDELEQLRNLPSNDPNLSLGNHFLAGVSYNGLTYSRSYTVIQNVGPAGTTLNITLTTSWTDDRGSHQVQMNMIHG